MLSLDNALNEAELRDSIGAFASTLEAEPFRYVAELKLDGLSMAAQYRRRPVQQGCDARRWPCRRGRDRKRAHHSSLPLKLRKQSWPTFEMRGEVVMTATASST